MQTDSKLARPFFDVVQRLVPFEERRWKGCRAVDVPRISLQALFSDGNCRGIIPKSMVIGG